MSPKFTCTGLMNGLALVKSEIAPTSTHKNRHNGSWRLFKGPSLDRHILDPDEDKNACNHQDHHNMTE